MSGPDEKLLQPEETRKSRIKTNQYQSDLEILPKTKLVDMNFKKYLINGAGEMAQQLRTLVTLAEAWA